ncbi:MAG: DMT family transporter [Candidatus Heimdallarchaeota archaeon]
MDQEELPEPDKELSTKPLQIEADKKLIPKHVYFLIALAMVMTSFASILIRYAGIDIIRIDENLVPADASVIAFWRLLFATIGMFLGAVFTRNLKEFKKVELKKDMPLLTLSGLALAIHFATWNISLQMTNVASSITIVYLMPLFALFLSVIFLKDKVSWKQAFVVVLTVAGAITVGLSDLLTVGLGNLYGDLFALAGGISGAVYFVIGRKKRERLDIFSYATIVYGICTIFLLIYVLSNPLTRPLIVSGLSWHHFLFFLLLAIGPSCLGHTLYNYSLGFVRAPVITVTALGEMFGATLLAILFFTEIPHWSAFIGMALVAAGIVVTVILENKSLKEQANEQKNTS